VLQVQHQDISDHRFEQRGLLHVVVQVEQQQVHVLVVHLGLVPASRVRQVQQILAYVLREVPPHASVVVAGDFNDWGPRTGRMLAHSGLQQPVWPSVKTYPARLPLVQLDRVFARGLSPLQQWVPHGLVWRQMSDHLPLVADFGWGVA
jgi:endonuclease/exonuclease/phosphatase family metal-dependent hydrolase